MYLELNTSKNWISEFIKQNNLILLTSSYVDLPENAPSWFKPNSGFEVFAPSEFKKGFISQGTVCFVDTKTGHMLIYEIQL
jgi:hypothetical protein